MQEKRKKVFAKKGRIPKADIPNEALVEASDHFKRLIFRALDYLPPGEVSFADYGRAIIEADKASHPELPRERKWIAEEFVKRTIVANEEVLLNEQIDPSKKDELVEGLSRIDMQTLVDSDWTAYEFVNRKRIRELLIWKFLIGPIDLKEYDFFLKI